MAYKTYNKNAAYSYCLGPYPAFECLKWRSDLVEAVFFDEQFNELEHLLEVCRSLHLKAQAAPELLARLAKHKKAPYVAVIWKKENFLRKLNRQAKTHLVLHEISDSGNLGTIIRSALAFEVRDIALVGQTVSPFLPEIAKAAMGASFAVRISCFGNLDAYLAEYGTCEVEAALNVDNDSLTQTVKQHTSYNNKRKLYTFCLSDQALPLSQILPEIKNDKQPRSLIFGNEGRGLPQECTGAPYIPIMIEQSADVDSLNLANACTLALYTFEKL